MSYHIQVVNKTSGHTTCCQLKIAGQQAFVCPKLAEGDKIEIVLEETEHVNRTVLAELVVPGPCEQEDKCKCLTMKRVVSNEFELIVEYTRLRVNSRNKRDLEWKLNQCALHLKSTHPIMQNVIEYMHVVRELEHAKIAKEAVVRALESAQEEETKAVLAMLDAKQAVSDRRRELEDAEKAYNLELERLTTTFGSLMKPSKLL